MAKTSLLVAVTALALTGNAYAWGQQKSARDADLSVAHPAFSVGAGPLVVIDSGHNNFHTVNGRYAPFAGLLRNDGFRVRDVHALSENDLRGVRILVISNALNTANVGNWKLPTPSAFTEIEIAAIRAWVNAGGALLLIADQFPFSGAASDLARAFGFTFVNGEANAAGVDMFSIVENTLSNDVIVRGRNAAESVKKVVTFGGSAFQAPSAARPLLVLSNKFELVVPDATGVLNAKKSQKARRRLFARRRHARWNGAYRGLWRSGDVLSAGQFRTAYGFQCSES
jgi:hypothetical protein